MRSRALLGLLLCLSLAVPCANPNVASGLEPVVEAHLDDVADAFAANGAAEVPGARACVAECALVRAALNESASPSSLVAENVRRDTRNAMMRQRVLPPSAVVVGGMGAIALGLVAQNYALKVGTGIRAKQLEHLVPERGDVIASGWGVQQTMMPAAVGTRFLSRGGYSAVMPTDGWYWTWWRYGWYDSRVETGGGCGGVHPRVPADFTKVFGTGNWCYPSASLAGGYVTPEDLRSTGSIQPYTNQPFNLSIPTWAGSPATIEALRAGLDLYLGDAPLVESAACAALDAQECDPPQREASRHKCDVEDQGAGGDPFPERGTSPDLPEYAQRYEIVPEASYSSPADAFPTAGVLPGNDLGQGRVYMRYGWAELSGNPIVLYRGMGYRKIYAKHGWGPLALAKTLEALSTDLAPVSETKTRDGVTRTTDTYSGPSYQRSGTTCRWTVVTQRNPDTREASFGLPGPGIITAYGRPA